MKEILAGLYGYNCLDEANACAAIKMIVEDGCAESHAAAFLSAYIMRRPSIAELRGFRRAMLELCTPIMLHQAAAAVDIVGTGGDNKNSFNISTLAALVTAAAGCPVIKHGNYGSSSVSGSSDVLQYLGYRFSADPCTLQAQMDRTNICFLHAPLFHPAIKHIAPVRKSLGARSFFNLLGPLINPARPGAQLLGVNSLESVRTYRYLLQEVSMRYAIVHSLDGYDEISLTDSFKLVTATQESLLRPAQLGFSAISPRDIDGGKTVQEAAAIFIRVLRGTGTAAQNNVVAVNSGLAIHTARPGITFVEGIAMAQEALVSQKAYQTFERLIQHSHEHA